MQSAGNYVTGYCKEDKMPGRHCRGDQDIGLIFLTQENKGYLINVTAQTPTPYCTQAATVNKRHVQPKVRKPAAGPRHVGALCRLIIWRPLKPIFFKLSRPKTGLATLFWGRVSKMRIIFGEIISRVETWVYYGAMFPIIPVLARPLVWLLPTPTPACEVVKRQGPLAT